MACITLLGAIGVEIKAPWGRYLIATAGDTSTGIQPPPPRFEQMFESGEWPMVAIVLLLELIFYRFSDIRSGPVIERMIFRNIPGPRPEV